MFGVNQLHTYNCSLTLSHKMKRVFDYNINLGVLVVHQFQTPFTLIDKDPQNGYTRVGIQQRAAFSYSVYENINRFRFLILHVPDEIIVPYKGYTFNSMLKYITKDDPQILDGSTISFHHKLFYIKQAPRVNQQENLLSMRYTSYISAKQISEHPSFNSKSFVVPDRCIYAYSHGCVCSDYKRYYVSTKYGSTHHYRASCGADYTGGTKPRLQRCSIFKKKYQIEIRMFRFKQKLLNRFTKIEHNLLRY